MAHGARPDAVHKDDAGEPLGDGPLQHALKVGELDVLDHARADVCRVGQNAVQVEVDHGGVGRGCRCTVVFVDPLPVLLELAALVRGNLLGQHLAQRGRHALISLVFLTGAEAHPDKSAQGVQPLEPRFVLHPSGVAFKTHHAAAPDIVEKPDGGSGTDGEIGSGHVCKVATVQSPTAYLRTMKHLFVGRGMLVAALVAVATGGFAQPIPPATLEGPALRSWLRDQWYTGSFVDLGYNGARTQMFSFTDAESGSVACVYTGFTMPAASTTFLDPLNCEHIVPQSFFGAVSPMKSDLYNMQPCHESANSARNNNGYGEVADASAQWYGISATGAYVTQGNIPAAPATWSERNGEVWEPREDRKGDIARMVFYFYTVYPVAAGDLALLASADVLYGWHLADPVTPAEVARTNRVEQVQGNYNPYVLHPDWVQRAWFPTGPAVSGCTDPSACNYLPTANVPDGSCTYPAPGLDCAGNATVSCAPFISEYIEGSSNNKYIELHNPLPVAWELTGYKLQNFANGAATASNTLNLSGLVAPGGVYVIANPAATSAALAQTTWSALQFNGDDAVALVDPTGAVLDAVGAIGTDPGTGWSVAGTANATVNTTLRRKSTVHSGNGGAWAASAGTMATDSEWLLAPLDDVSGLGAHSVDASCSTETCPDTNGNGICDDAEVPIPGCAYVNACNFLPTATEDDGSCIFTSCIAWGCTYPDALNFDPDADFDDGSCEYAPVNSGSCSGDLDGDGTVAVADLLLMLGAFGSLCP